ncbi:hypothetical protein [Pseudomonas sp. Hg5Tf]|uniref:Uncharacterized protein n=1 Tax=Pseudomonas sp. Hg7Tf TaxID=3236988 RepID=A0AB39HW75_9PSED|nr:hypothetical protein [Pseudomonas sp. Hg5Tf]MDH2562254.1 hypothetical protein [Pseudomonas sp. Hg5Tf]
MIKFTAAEIQAIIDDQEHIAAVVSLEMSIEIELAEADWLTTGDFLMFANGLRKAA